MYNESTTVLVGALAASRRSGNERRVCIQAEQQQQQQQQPTPRCANSARSYIAAVSAQRATHDIVLSRRDQVLLAQLPSGHSRRLAACYNIIDSSVDPICHKCDAAPHTLEHLLQECPHNSSTTSLPRFNSVLVQVSDWKDSFLK